MSDRHTATARHLIAPENSLRVGEEQAHAAAWNLLLYAPRLCESDTFVRTPTSRFRLSTQFYCSRRWYRRICTPFRQRGRSCCCFAQGLPRREASPTLAFLSKQSPIFSRKISPAELASPITLSRTIRPTSADLRNARP
jgi:hypothetical protein